MIRIILAMTMILSLAACNDDIKAELAQTKADLARVQSDLNQVVEYHRLTQAIQEETMLLQDLREQTQTLNKDLDSLANRAILARSALPAQAYLCKGNRSCEEETAAKAKIEAVKMNEEVDTLNARSKQLGEETSLHITRHKQAETAMKVARAALPPDLQERLLGVRESSH